MNGVNWDEITVSERTSVQQEGTYTFKVGDVDTQISKNGDDMVVVNCDTKDEGSLRMYFLLNQNNLWKVKKFAMAVDETALKHDDPEEVLRALLGKKFVGVVTRQKPRLNPATQMMEEGKYLEISSFRKLEA